jgi:hypothetical protein
MGAQFTAIVFFLIADKNGMLNIMVEAVFV